MERVFASQGGGDMRFLTDTQELISSTNQFYINCIFLNMIKFLINKILTNNIPNNKSGEERFPLPKGTIGPDNHSNRPNFVQIVITYGRLVGESPNRSSWYTIVLDEIANGSFDLVNRQSKLEDFT